MPRCFECHENCATIKALFLHFKILHKNNIHTFRCAEAQCDRHFNNLHSFREHLKKKHIFSYEQGQLIAANQLPVDTKQAAVTAVLPINEINSEVHKNRTHACFTSIEENLSIEQFSNILERETASLIASLYNITSLPRSVVQLIINFFQSFIEVNTVPFIRKNIRNVLVNHNASEDSINEIESYLEIFRSSLKPFSTDYLRMKFFEKSEYFIKPISHTIKYEYREIQQNGKVTIEPCPVFVQCIPLRIVIKKFFEKSNFVFDMCSYMDNLLKSEANNISNITQTSYWKQKIQTKEYVIPIYLYFDDFETGNPLGSHSGIYKLGGVYISFACLPPEYSSRLENIIVAMLFFSHDREIYGNRDTFRFLIDELKYLETEGILVETPTKRYHFYFVLALILGDNLGLHSILGYMESFNANYPCRFCKIKKRDQEVSVTLDNNLLRNKVNYDIDVQISNPSLTGIKERCIWNDLSHFHVCDNFSIDIMHDVFEGVCHYDLIPIFKYFIIDLKLFTVDVLNSRISGFNYSSHRKNKPPLLSQDFYKKTKISMSAAEMWTFVTCLGLMIGDLIPENNPEWELYLLLREIIDIITSRTVCPEYSPLLQTLVEEHNEIYISLFKYTLKPKHHHLLHYPLIMKTIGPLINIWSMRYEAKHQELKSYAQVCCSRRNLTYSLAMKQQLQLCYQLHKTQNTEFSIVLGPTEPMSLQCLNKFINRDFSTFPISLREKCFVTNWITKGDNKIKSKDIIISKIENSDVQFGIIEHILLDEIKNIYFVGYCFETVGFNRHVFAYEVKKTKNIFCIELELVLDLYKNSLIVMSDGCNYIYSKNLP